MGLLDHINTFFKFSPLLEIEKINKKAAEKGLSKYLVYFYGIQVVNEKPVVQIQ